MTLAPAAAARPRGLPFARLRRCGAGAMRDAIAANDVTEVVLDLRGLRCPQPVLRAKKTLRKLPAGSVLVMECTDPLTVIDVPHFCNQTGNALDRQERDGDLYIFRIVKRQ